jgi:hypothetical protein
MASACTWEPRKWEAEEPTVWPASRWLESEARRKVKEWGLRRGRRGKRLSGSGCGSTRRRWLDAKAEAELELRKRERG